MVLVFLKNKSKKLSTRKYIEAGKDQEGKGYDPRKLLAPGSEAIVDTVKEIIGWLGTPEVK